MEAIRKEAVRIALLAGKKIKELRDRKQFNESIKNGYEFVTTADLISNELIKSEIAKAFPGHQFLSEEERVCGISIQEPTWIVDPIDGTVGYANDHYQVAVSIAFAVDNKVRVGVVYNPFLEELFYAVENLGAFLNDKPINAKAVNSLKQCVIGTGFPHKREDLLEMMAILHRLLSQIRDIRRLGSPALDICWVACGRLQGFYEERLKPWDIAAARLIAIEAGAKAGFYSSKFDPEIIDCLNGHYFMVSSPGVFDEFRKMLQPANK